MSSIRTTPRHCSRRCMVSPAGDADRGRFPIGLDRSPILGRTVTETGRLETFADGVLAIRLPDSREDLGAALLRQWPEFVGYLVSFLTIGIMWVQHHRLFTLIRR